MFPIRPPLRLPLREWLNWTSFRITFHNLTERQPQPWPALTDLKSALLSRVPDLFSYPARVWPIDPVYRQQWKVGA